MYDHRFSVQMVASIIAVEWRRRPMREMEAAFPSNRVDQLARQLSAQPLHLPRDVAVERSPDAHDGAFVQRARLRRRVQQPRNARNIAGLLRLASSQHVQLGSDLAQCLAPLQQTIAHSRFALLFSCAAFFSRQLSWMCRVEGSTRIVKEAGNVGS